MILTSESEFLQNEVGAKATNLQTLTRAGFQVPAFVVLPVSTISQFDAVEEKVVQEITSTLSVKEYAVRSAALIEDSSSSSMAGQFLTRLAVSPQELALAIRDVVAQARTLDNCSEGGLSVIIQEFVMSEYAGVLFTRNPLGGCEQVVNYVQGLGEQVVSGGESLSSTIFQKPTPEQAKLLPCMNELSKKGQEIEGLFEFPQDIEWCYKAGQLLFLQARPITSVTKKQCVECVYLDSVLPPAPFLLQQTTVTESFSRPTPLAVSLLRALYKQDGPIAEAYRKLGVSYFETEQFKIIGNQLYVDKQAETKSTFPALGFIKHQSQKPRVESLAGLWTTLKNSKKLRRVSTEVGLIQPDFLVDILLQEPVETQTLEEALERLLSVYPLIFSINLRNQLALARLATMAYSAEILQTLLQNTQSTISISVKRTDVPGSMVGNSISIDDTSDFFAQDFVPADNENILPAHWKLKALTPNAIEVQNWIQLRELGRWVSVRLISGLREAVQRLSYDANVSQDLLSFASLDELLVSVPSREILSNRKIEFESYHNFDFPPTLTSFVVPKKAGGAVVLSAGQVEGILCSPAELATVSGPKILLVQKLSPDLTKYFPEVVGIVCTEGGLLSHLAIMAREAQLPVVLSREGARLLGGRVVIDHEAEEPLRLLKEE